MKLEAGNCKSSRLQLTWKQKEQMSQGTRRRAQGTGERKWEMSNTNEWKIHNNLITLGTDV